MKHNIIVNILLKASLTLIVIFYTMLCEAQQTASFSPRIKTVKAEANGEWGVPPLILQSRGQYVDISFDDLQASYERYTYTITHCNADWTKSDLLVSEYMTGFNDQHIEDYEPAIGTEMDYCHYFFTLPNDNTKLLVSGNYKVEIFEDGEDAPVAQACFSIIEPHVGVDINVSANTDIDYFAQHQQLSFSINYSGYAISNPISELKPVIMQNRRWDTHVEGVNPSSMRVNQLIYDHQRKLIFPAGNEFRRFEILDEYVPTMRVDHMEFSDPYYHATLFTDEQRINYLYDQDQNGRFYVRNGDNVNNDTESDYFYTHFALSMPKIGGGEVYLWGDLTDNRIDERYKMDYNLIDHQYEIALPLKQGSYNYQYIFVHDGEDIGTFAPTEGNFHQTENEYWVYVYQRPFGSRYDKLVGFQKYNYKQ
ncbi:MAG: DUF5103 domain-containing protein [Prevotellaceae bacterium]|nr:DUF5103 domain-containing protein [Candidatus Minthosoma caballi]